MKIGLLTLFPELFEPLVRLGFVGKAVQRGLLQVLTENLREHGLGVHRSVDDTPYGGGSGMVMRVDCLASGMDRLSARAGCSLYRVLLTPQGRPFNQNMAHELVEKKDLLLVCGRYEGFDERVRSLVDQEVSLGDFVMTGGEVAAMAVIETCVRLIPGVLGNQSSTLEESFSSGLDGMLEYPQYTRPASFMDLGVPQVLLSGDHAKVAAWRRQQARQRTSLRRPELLVQQARKPESKSE
jgi:tRNA (guanine37-N1)-methyltransferase